MTPRRYHPLWRALAGLISLAMIILLVQILRGEANTPDWAAIAGMVLVLLLLPYMCITGRAPAWFERMSRPMSNDR
jgi:hypothetical protein